MFSGSYAAGDVQFLLKPLEMAPIADVVEKERLIQSGQRHYSEIVGVEKQPSAQYLALFHRAVELNARRMAVDLVRLAQALLAARPKGLTLVSLARAGTPIGVLLRRLLVEHFEVEAPHYSISIIRDRGIDTNALNHICRHHPAPSIAFIDGWTGKGAIGLELTRSIARYRADTGFDVRDELFVLCDLAGLAHAAGSSDDYLIPSAILNSTVSGLVSRSILNHLVGASDFHGCLYHAELSPADLSRWFVDRLLAEVRVVIDSVRAEVPAAIDRTALAQRSQALLADLMERFGVADRNYIKPGIGEATRSLLRRTPRVLLLRDPDTEDVQHMTLLAQEQGVPLHIEPTLSLQAVSIIRKLGDA